MVERERERESVCVCYTEGLCSVISLCSVMTSLDYSRGTWPSLHYVRLGVFTPVGTDGRPPAHMGWSENRERECVCERERGLTLNALLLASTATAMGPTLATADWRSFSLPLEISILPDI